MNHAKALSLSLVWGILAELTGLVTRQDLVAAIQAWKSRKGVLLSTILSEGRAFDPAIVHQIEQVVEVGATGHSLEALIKDFGVNLQSHTAGLLKNISDPSWRAELWAAVESELLHTSSRSETNLDHEMISDIRPEQGRPFRLQESAAELYETLDQSGSLGENRHERVGETVDMSAVSPHDLTSDGGPRPFFTEVSQAGLERTQNETLDVAGPMATGDFAPTEAFTPGQPRTAMDETEQGFAPPSDSSYLNHGTAAHLGGASRYRIVKELARGGLGAVFLANDVELNRSVVVKEIQGRHADRDDTRSRFLREAEVTGGLEHPSIVPIYGLNQYDDGRPYYAMKFIEGESMQDAIDNFYAKNKGERDPAERSLAFRQLLKQFISVCEAISYAHSRGVLHRDLKPANVMLGRFGETLVVDWGLAKPLGRCFPYDEQMGSRASKQAGEAELKMRSVGSEDEVAGLTVNLTQPTVEIELSSRRPLMPSASSMASETMMGSKMGTPPYMSPEQARGDVDQLGPASDIYSLGSTLYCLVTGEMPYTGKRAIEILQNVEKGEFTPPRERNPQLDKPLEAIVIKAMALHANERYASAKAMADDIERYLGDEPVSAYPDPWQVRARRWLKRHRTAVAGVGVLLITGVTALSISTVLIERERRLVTANFQLAYDAADTMLSEVADIDLADIPQMEPVRRKLLQTALGKFADLLKQKSMDSSVQLLEGRTQARLGNVLEMMGDYTGAEKVYREALTTLQGFGGAGRVALARAQQGLAVLEQKLNRFKDSEASFRKALALREEILKSAPNDPIAKEAVAETRYQFGVLLSRLTGRSGEDEKLYQEAISDQKAAVASDPTGKGAPAKLARYLNNLAKLEFKTKPEDSEARYREILELVKSLDEPLRNLPAARWQSARAMNNLGSIHLHEKERIADSQSYLDQAKKLLETLVAEFPTISAYRKELVGVLINLSFLQREQERYALAEPLTKKAEKLLSKLAADEPQDPEHPRKLAVVLNELTTILSGHDPKGARAAFEKSKSIQEDLTKRYPEVNEYVMELGRTLSSYATILREQDNPTEAKGLFLAAKVELDNAFAVEPKNTLIVKQLYENQAKLLVCLTNLNEFDEAATLASTLPDILPDDARSYLQAAMGLSRCVLKMAGSSAERADVFGRRAVEILKAGADRGLIRSLPPLMAQELVPLRTRPDFLELLKRVKNQAVPGVG
jgi:serine/threonine-protein kinase